MDANVARFGPFEFDFSEMVLRRDGEPVALQPQPTQVLAILLQSPGRLVGRDELKQKVWEGRVVEFDAGLNFSINQVRRALGDTATDPRFLETVHRRGYRFIADVDRSGRRRERILASRVRAAGAGVLGLIAVALLGVRVLERRGDSAEVRSLAALPVPVQTTYRAAQFLYEQSDARRALVKLDSVRLAEPGFAEAWTLTSHARRASGDLTGARAAAERAVELDPESADARYAEGLAAFMQAREDDAVSAFAEASRLAPSSIQYRQWYAEALANQLRLDDAIEQLEEARRLDPISNLVGGDLASVYIAARRLDEAATYCEGRLELVESGEQWARECLMTAHHFKGNDQLALDDAHALMDLAGAAEDERAQVTTLPDYFRWNLARIDSLAGTGETPGPFERVKATARLGDRAETLRGLRAMRAAGAFQIQWVPRDPWFWFLRGDADFEAILREAGLPVPSQAS